MATPLIIIATLLTHFKENKLGLDLGGVKNNSIVLVEYL